MIKQLLSWFKKPGGQPEVSSARQGTPGQVAETYIQTLLNHSFGGAVTAHVPDEHTIQLSIINAADPSRLIGKEGATIESIQLLTKALLNRTYKRGFRVTIDVGECNPNREAVLLAHIDKAIEAMGTDGVYHFPKMTAIDRRFIHVQFEQHPLYVSQSEGAGSQRHVVLRQRTGS
ncbi:KH domain-containing protein [bacterium]|nr:KH domain-containing protein [bacterium]